MLQVNTFFSFIGNFNFFRWCDNFNATFIGFGRRCNKLQIQLYHLHVVQLFIAVVKILAAGANFASIFSFVMRRADLLSMATGLTRLLEYRTSIIHSYIAIWAQAVHPLTC
jgi:hypothetical protein